MGRAEGKKYVIYDVAIPSGYDKNYVSGAVFSRKSRKFTLRFIMGETFTSFLFIFVSFPVKRRTSHNHYEVYPPYYPVDEEIFISKMNEWGVQLDPPSSPDF